MLFLIIFFSVVMVIDCFVLTFLVLMQLPKKEAGAGMAFGAGATDALFGAGSGNVLTKLTKYSAGIFFALALLLSILESRRAHQPGSAFMQRVQQQQQAQPAITAPPAPAPATTPATTTPGTNLTLQPVEKTSNVLQMAPPAAPSNAPAAPTGSPK
jgi:preprotein translocase subunit SecG